VHAAMTEMIVLMTVTIVFMTVDIVLVTIDMSRAVHFMTIDLIGFNIGPSGIRCTFKTSKNGADKHGN
jgi:hypothetical protein